MKQPMAPSKTRRSNPSSILLILSLSTSLISGCSGQLDVSEEMRIVGSTSAMPYAKAIADDLSRRSPNLKIPVIESTGTGIGISVFCRAVGGTTPDMVFTSREMKADEIAECRKNGVTEVMNFQLAMDGIVLTRSVNAPELSLSLADIYPAFAASPYASSKRPKLWNEIRQSLPASPIIVYGPPASTGTQNAFSELILKPHCEAAPNVISIKDENLKKRVCSKVREDGAYVDVGENDRLMVQKLSATSSAIGLMSFARAQVFPSDLKLIPIEGVQPSVETIQNLSYPGSRPIYLYVKIPQMRAVPGVTDYVTLLQSEKRPKRPAFRQPPDSSQRRRVLRISWEG